MENQNNTFYSVKFETKDGVQPLRYFQNFQDLKKYLDLLEMLHDVICIIEDDVPGCLYFAFTKKDGGMVDLISYSFPAYASLENFG